MARRGRLAPVILVVAFLACQFPGGFEVLPGSTPAHTTFSVATRVGGDCPVALTSFSVARDGSRPEVVWAFHWPGNSPPPPVNLIPYGTLPPGYTLDTTALPLVPGRYSVRTCIADPRLAAPPSGSFCVSSSGHVRGDPQGGWRIFLPSACP